MAPNPLILSRYLDGSATPAERAEVERWIAGDPARPAAMAELQAAWRRGDRSGWYNARTAWAKVGPRTTAMPARRFALVPSRRSAPWLAAAASIALLLGAGTWYLQRRSTPVASAVTTVASATGQLRVLHLPDGTLATLGTNSRLSYDGAFGGRERAVTVEGAAFFQVTHDSTRPFRVRAHGAETRVLGTEFSVRAYADEPTVEVVVKSGRVAFGAVATPPAVLHPGDLGRLAADGRVAVSAVDPSRYLSWTAGRLDFDDVRLADVVRELNRWYGLNLIVDDAGLAERRIIKSFAQTDREQIVRSLTALVGAEAVGDGTRLVLRPKRHEPTGHR